MGINYEAANFMASQLSDQYAKQRELGYKYKYESDLPGFFYAQAAKLSANGLTSIYDVGEQDGVLINKVTGEPIEKISLRGNWRTDPTSFKIGPEIKLEDRGSFNRWGKDVSVEGQADYGIDFVDGVPVFTPYHKDTSTRILGMKLEDAAKLAVAGTALYFGGSALLSQGGAAAGTGATGTGTAISGAGLTSAEMAALKGAEGYGAGLLGPGTAISGAGLTSAEMAALKGSEAAYGAASPGMAISGGGLTSAEMQALKGAEAYGPLASSGIGVGEALRTAAVANALLNPPILPQQSGLLGGGGQPRGVDFSPLYRNTIVGLLPGAELYRRSLI